jgi:RNase P/RNase MRP subunit POP5
MKLKKMPSLKEKKRYILFKVHSEEPISYENVKNAVYDSVAEWFGANDLAKANVHIVKNLWNGKNQTGVIRCSPKFVDDVKVAMALVHQIGDERVIIQSTRVSGTIKSIKKKSKI